MTTIWVVVIVTGVATLALKAAGPLLLGGKPLPARVTSLVSLLAPALLAALVAIGTFAQGQRLVDRRARAGRRRGGGGDPPARAGAAGGRARRGGHGRRPRAERLIASAS